MRNFRAETEDAIKDSGHTLDDIVFIGSKDGEYSCNWPEFRTLADREYDSGFGASEVATDLIIAFSDGSTMWRGEYDGSEWWEFSKPFQMPEKSKPIEFIFAEDKDEIGWARLDELNGETKEAK